MKIIDLLNKIANGEELPVKIFCFSREFYLKENTYFGDTFPLMHYIQEEDLNDEVEILDDEEKGLPEKINDWISTVGRVDDSNIEKYVHILFEQQTQLYCKMNELIDYLEKQRRG